MVSDPDVYPPEQKTSKLALLAFAMSFCCSPLGIVLGLIAWMRAAASPELKGSGWAILAMLIGTVITLAAVIAFMVVQGLADLMKNALGR